MKTLKNVETYATVYEPTSLGIAHCCIHYEDTETSRNHTLSGAMFISELRKKCKCTILDISKCTHFFDCKDVDSIIKYGGKVIRFKQLKRKEAIMIKRW